MLRQVGVLHLPPTSYLSIIPVFSVFQAFIHRFFPLSLGMCSNLSHIKEKNRKEEKSRRKEERKEKEEKEPFTTISFLLPSTIKPLGRIVPMYLISFTFLSSLLPSHYNLFQQHSSHCNSTRIAPGTDTGDLSVS